MVDRSEVSRALAKAIAYKNCGKDAEAKAWAIKRAGGRMSDYKPWLGTEQFIMPVSNSRKIRVNACDSCACVLVNGDSSHLDMYDEETAESIRNSIAGSEDAIGPVTHISAINLGGYWDCFFCGSTEIGNGHEFEGEDKA